MIYTKAEIKDSKFGSICNQMELKMQLCDLHREGEIRNSVIYKEGEIKNSKIGSICNIRELKRVHFLQDLAC